MGQVKSYAKEYIMSKIESLEMEIAELGRLRTVWVYLPDNYDESGEPLPVIYMHDGQNLFYDRLASKGVSWRVDKTLDELFAQTGKSCIVVGVECNDKVRLSEYSPWRVRRRANKSKRTVVKSRANLGGEGKKYGEWFAKTLKPYIDEKYNTDKDRVATAVAGSSMGAYISCYLALNYQRVYETMGLFSTYMQFNEPAFYKYEKNTSQAFFQHALVYVGGREWGDVKADKLMIEQSNTLYNKLVERGITCEFIVSSKLSHNEKAWEIYFRKFAEDFINRYHEYKQSQQ